MYSVGLLHWSQCEVHLCELKARGTASYSYITSFQGYTAVNVIFFLQKYLHQTSNYTSRSQEIIMVV